jgi:hypothetical protein
VEAWNLVDITCDDADSYSKEKEKIEKCFLRGKKEHTWNCICCGGKFI